MNENNYTHIPIYQDGSKKELVGIFSENSIFQYLLKDKIIEVDVDKKFSDIKEINYMMKLLTILLKSLKMERNCRV